MPKTSTVENSHHHNKNVNTSNYSHSHKVQVEHVAATASQSKNSSNTQVSVNHNSSRSSNPGAASTSAATVNRKSDIHQHLYPSELQYPITPEIALQYFEDKLSPYEKTEIFNYKEIYFLGLNAKKRRQEEPINGLNGASGDLQSSGANGTASKSSTSNAGAAGSKQSKNYNYDDDQGSYILVPNDHISYRYEVLRIIGKGSFGQVIKAFDHKNKTTVSIKIVRNEKRFHRQALEEIRILRKSFLG